jgi:energy-coupling factor transport system permease protein
VDNFEFLRMVNIGQYLPLDSFIHRRDPRARILAYLALIMAITFARHWAGLAVGLMVVLALLGLSRVPLRFALQSLKPPLPFLIFLAILQIFLTGNLSAAPALWSYGFLHIYPSGLIAAGMLMLRFAVLILALGLSSYTLSTSELIHGLESLLSPFQRLGIPTRDLVMIVQITFRFIPFLAQDAERIAKAQAARGAEWGVRKGNLLARARQVIPLMIPLFLTSLRRAESMALAMDARCYGGTQARSSMMEMRFTGLDALWVFAVTACAVAILAIQAVF